MAKFLSLLTTVACTTSASFAQIGDRQDKAGEVQQQLVPPELVPPSPALTPAEAMKTFRVAPGYKLELVAADPLVQDPVAMAFGADGRMWVVEMRGYMPDLDGNGEDAPIGRVVVLRDRDGDGRYEESKVFVDGLVLPRAILPVADGVLVGAPPELAFWRDTDGDGKADQKTVVANDYGVMTDPKRPQLANPERAPNSLFWAYDNWIYSAAYVKKFRFANGQWETAATDFRGQWGLSQDNFGRFYHGSNEDHLRVDVIFGDYLRRNPDYPQLGGFNVNGATNQLVWPGRVTPGTNRAYRPEILRDNRWLKNFTTACAFQIYRGDLMPELTGNFFVAEPGANLVRREILTAENGSIRGVNAYANDQQEFIVSTDERFRPVNFATGPDGALYLVDFYRGVLQHRISLTTYLRKQYESRNLATPRHLGRIYRVVPSDRAVPRAPAAPTASAEWVALLSHPNGFWRTTAQRILVERRDASVMPALRELVRTGAAPLGRVHALWTLEGMGALDRESVVTALDHADPVVRTMAMRLSERFLGDERRGQLIQKLISLAKAGPPEVQLQAVLSLGEAREPAVDRTLAELVRTNPQNTFLAEAFYSGIANREFGLIERFTADRGWRDDDPAANRILGRLAEGVFASRDRQTIEGAMLMAAESADTGRGLAMIDGLAAAAARTRRPLQLPKRPPGWPEFSRRPALAAQVAKLNQALAWPDKPAEGNLATPLTAEEATRFELGKTLFTATCATCHQPTGRGLDGLAPPLLDSEWVLGSPARIIRIALHGLRGPIVVLGREHTGDMPAFKALEDDQLAAVLTYVRREWGHTASAISPAEVKAVRAATSDQVDSSSARELVEAETK